jgi:cell wall-associated NlpC family hydrolase
MSDQLRQAIIDEAATWLRTPYHHMAAIKGAGVDCAQILIEVYSAVGLTDKPNVGNYSPDWMLHRSEEVYLSKLKEYCIEVEAPKMGDIVMFKFGRCFSHSGIVTEWPRLIHAQREDGCCYADATQGNLADQEVRFFSFFGKSA